MRREQGRFNLRVAVFLPAAFLLLSQSALSAQTGTTIQRVRLGLHKEYTRLVFDAVGAKPEQVVCDEQMRTLVLFGNLEKPVTNKKYRGTASAISSIDFKSGSNPRAIIRHKKRDVLVKQMTLPGDPPRKNHYRLVLDFYPGRLDSTKAKSATTEEAGSPTAPGRDNLKTVSSPKPPAGSPVVGGSDSPAGTKSEQTSPSREVAVEQKDGNENGVKGGRAEPSIEEGPQGIASVAEDAFIKASLMNSRQIDGLYQEADDYYRNHSSQLKEYGTFVIDRYKAAFEADPKHRLAPLALYRCGEAAFDMAGHVMAEGYLQRLIAAFPDDPLVGSSWYLIGRTKFELEQYDEAIKAFQVALESSLDPRQSVEAEYLLGTSLNLVGESEQAVAALERCIEKQPKYYIEQPAVLRSLGESYFNLKEFDKSLNYLIWYVNLAPSNPEDNNLLLARIAESFHHEGEPRLANKLYRYIQSYLPDSEGDVISKIRGVEEYEKKGDNGRQAALSILLELRNKSLSENLSRLVRFKLAYNYWKLGEPKKGLQVVEEVLSNNPGSASMDEFYALRGDLIKDLVRQAYAEKDYLEVVALDRENRSNLQVDPDLEVDPLVAESYAQLKLYPSAIAIYNRLAIVDDKNKDDWILQAARCSLKMRELEKAADYCDSVKSNSLESEKTGLMAQILFAKKKYGEAARYFERMFKKTKDISKVDWQFIMDYSECLMEAGRQQDALIYLQKASEHPAAKENDHHLQLCMALGKCYQELDQPTDALPFYEEALDLIQEQDRKEYVIYKIAKIYKQAGQLDQAKSMFSQLLASGQSLWRAVAREQINDIAIKTSEPT